MMSKTIIVSNRLPVKVSLENDQIVLQVSEGGLATGLGSIYKHGANVWIGWPGKEVEISVVRNGEEFKCNITPALDIFTQKYKLGLWVKNSTSGVGTLTYVKKSDNRFGAVGHSLTDATFGDNYKVAEGEVYLCN